MLLTQTLSIIAAKSPKHPAFVNEHTHETYAAFRSKVGRLAHFAFSKWGARKKIALLSQNSSQAAAFLLAFSQTRSTTLLLDPDESFEDWKACIEEFGADVLLVSDAFKDAAETLIEQSALKIPYFLFDSIHAGEFPSLYSASHPEYAAENADPVVCVRTLGSGQKRRLVEFSHQQIEQSFSNLRDCYLNEPNETYYTPLSWSHAYALTHALFFPLFSGQTIRTLTAVPLPKSGEATRIIASPGSLSKVTPLLKQAKTLTLSLSSLTEEQKSSLEKNSPELTVLFTYGITEATWSVSCTRRNTTLVKDLSTYQPIGFPLKCIEFCILDEAGEPKQLQASTLGELAIRGSTLASNEWLKTRDIVQVILNENEFYFFYVGPKAQSLKRDGIHFSAEELDAMTFTLEGVTESTTFLVSDFGGEEKLVFACVCTEGAQLDEEQVLASFIKNLPPHKHPERAFFVKEIPKTKEGKPDRVKLSHLFEGSPL